MQQRIRDYEKADYDHLIDLIYLPFKARGVSKEAFLKEFMEHPSAALDLENDRIRIFESENARFAGCYRYSKP